VHEHRGVRLRDTPVRVDPLLMVGLAVSDQVGCAAGTTNGRSQFLSITESREVRLNARDDAGERNL